jgi:ribulose-bisphosphate carboxylase large chain
VNRTDTPARVEGEAMTGAADASAARVSDLLAVEGMTLSGERIGAEYRLRCRPDDAIGIARFLVHEHSLELPASVLPEGFLREEIVGRIEAIETQPDGTTLCRLSYAAELGSGGLPTLLSLLMGNGAFLPSIELVGIDLPPTVLAPYPGPRFGVDGLRRLTGAVGRPFGATALKPVGASPRELARIARAIALGGLDILKEDDGVSTQVFAPFKERVARCAEAVRAANALTGKNCLYFVNVTGPIESLAERCFYAKAQGATGIEVLVGPMGLDAMRMAAALHGLDLPVMAHCAWQGALVRQPHPALSIPLVFGTLPRLAGADISIMVGFGGRFGLPRSACEAMAGAVRQPFGHLLPTVAAPGGGITFETMPDYVEVFGRDCALLMSGALFGRADLTDACKAYMAALGA